jgi:hypothetical protein
MGNRFFSFAGAMVWATLPIGGGLYYWEHTLQLTASDHMFIQVLLLPVVFTWAYFWNKHAEYERLRYQLDHKDRQTWPHYSIVTESSLAEEPISIKVAAFYPRKTACKDEAAAEMTLSETQYPIEVNCHVSND